MSFLDIKELVKVVRDAKDGLERAKILALVKVLLSGEAKAKDNYRKEFIGRNGRTLSGMLLNSIYSGMEKPEGDDLTGFVGVRNIPYGAVHEFGSDGPITPKKAKHLWVKNHHVDSRFKRMTPREFMQSKMQSPDEFSIHKTKSGNLAAWHVDLIGKGKAKRQKVTALFFLLDSVKIPERPYIRPAVAEAWEEYPLAFAQFIAKEMYG